MFLSSGRRRAILFLSLALFLLEVFDPSTPFVRAFPGGCKLVAAVNSVVGVGSGGRCEHDLCKKSSGCFRECFDSTLHTHAHHSTPLSRKHFDASFLPDRVTTPAFFVHMELIGLPIFRPPTLLS